ncbi:MAG: hypothetical protein WAW75_05975 [Gallionella sp.]|jgi:hypothetical protein
MKRPGFFLAALLSAQAFSAPTVPIVPLQQNLTVVEYSSAGRQTGCGLRITGVARQNLSLNVLITVFMKEPGITFGVVKVVARKIAMENGMPLPQDGTATHSSLGKILKAWIKPASGSQSLIYQNGESSHNDAYMVSSEFTSTVDLLVAISQENFVVGLNRSEAGPDDIFQFDQRISQEEAGKLSVCMKNLRAEIEESKSHKTF